MYKNSDIIDCHMILDRTPPPLYELDLQFADEDADEGPRESYLQISVQSGVDPRVIRFIVPTDKYDLSFFSPPSFHFFVFSLPPLLLFLFFSSLCSLLFIVLRRLSALYQKIMAWTGRPILRHANTMSTLPSITPPSSKPSSSRYINLSCIVESFVCY